MSVTGVEPIVFSHFYGQLTWITWMQLQFYCKPTIESTVVCF